MAAWVYVFYLLIYLVCHLSESFLSKFRQWSFFCYSSVSESSLRILWLKTFFRLCYNRLPIWALRSSSTLLVKSKMAFFKGFPTLNLDEIKHSSIPSVKPDSTQCVYPPAYNGRNITALSISWAIAKHLRNSQRHQTNSLFSSSVKMDSFQASGGLTWIGPNLYY